MNDHGAADPEGRGNSGEQSTSTDLPIRPHEKWTEALQASVSSTFLRKIEQFLSWPAAWDGHGAERISARTAARAAAVAKLTPVAFAEPIVSPAADGSLLLRWANDALGVQAETFIEPDSNVVTLMVETPDSSEEMTLLSPFDVPGRLSEFLSRRANSLRTFPSPEGYGCNNDYWSSRHYSRSDIFGPVDIYGGHGVAVESLDDALDDIRWNGNH